MKQGNIKEPREYKVEVACNFDAHSPEEATKIMADWLSDNIGECIFQVSWYTDLGNRASAFVAGVCEDKDNEPSAKYE